jgi:hypothetical protein
MTRLFLAAGAAALAIAAPATAERGGHGGGNKAHAAKAERGGGKAHAAKAQRRGGGFKASAKADRRGGQRFAAVDRKGRAAKSDRRDGRDQRIANRIDRRDGVRVRDFRGEDRFDRRFASRGLIDGCPPGLAKKHDGCLPPGHAKRLDLIGRVIPSAYSRGIVPLGLRDLYRDNDDYYYRYGDGYMYRVDRRTNLVASLLPLFGGGYMAGQLFPTSYTNSYVPNYYQGFYPDTADNYYRYANGNVYGIDPYSGMIGNVIPMYGYGYGYGQMLPTSYSAYNVPYQYRSIYYDTPNYNYRYAPGAIYQVDPRSNLITAVASLLAGDLGVGSRLPVGYSAYNVPLAYRSSYYDTPNAWYRYNDGYIYRVDPKTRLVTAVINGLV